MTKYDDRIEKFTNAEFKALNRNINGDIDDDLEMACIWMTKAQVEKLTGDDQTRVDNHQEEMRYMISQL